MTAITTLTWSVHRRLALVRATRRDDGASLVEYALLVALIAIVCIAAVAFFGGETSEEFSKVANSVSDAG